MQVTRPKLFISASIVFLMLALFTGIFRLMNDNSINTGILTSLYGLHPIVMVFGFLASIVMAERVAGISVIPELSDSKLPLTMVPLLGAGVVSEILGYTESVPIAKYLGSLFLIAGCVVFLFVLIRLATKSGIRLPFYYMMLSVVPLLGAAELSSFELPAGQPAFIMLLLSFPMIFILGERVELSKFTTAKSSTRKFTAAFVASGFAVASFLAASLEASYRTQAEITSLGLVFLFATLFIVLSAEVSNFKMLAKSIQPLQRYVSIHTRVAYAWAIAGIVFAEIYLLSPFDLDFYDAFIHSLAVGFIGTMILAHGPVILPSVTGRKLQSGAISIIPLVLLTLANLIRIGGEMILNISYSYSVGIIVGLSGWIVLASVLLFLREILSKSRPRKENAITIKRNLGVLGVE